MNQVQLNFKSNGFADQTSFKFLKVRVYGKKKQLQSSLVMHNIVFSLIHVKGWRTHKKRWVGRYRPRLFYGKQFFFVWFAKKRKILSQGGKYFPFGRKECHIFLTIPSLFLSAHLSSPFHFHLLLLYNFSYKGTNKGKLFYNCTSL